MFVERLQVDEGFLNGLDLRLLPGLNVLIGARGTGKTSVIELIRFCLGIRPVTSRLSNSSSHALSVLGGGRVTVTLASGEERIRVTRGADDAEPRASGRIGGITVLGTNEIEFVGLEEQGRLRLIDLFRGSEWQDSAAELSYVRSLTAHIRDVSEEIAGIDEQLASLSSVPHELLTAEGEANQSLVSMQATADDRQRLETLQGRGADLVVRDAVFERAATAMADLRARLVALRSSAPGIDSWPEAAHSDDPLLEVRSKHALVVEGLGGLAQEVREIEEAIAALRKRNTDERSQTEDSSRELRQRLEGLQEGAGAIARRLATLREQAGQLEALASLRSEKMVLLNAASLERSERLSRVEASREGKYLERCAVADDLNEKLGPRIDVSIVKSELDSEYIAAIAEGLRGSGLHYNSLAPMVAGRMSPRELVSAIEGNEAPRLSELTEIGTERAEKIIQHLRPHTEDILSANIEDGVSLALLDGSEYKQRLSTGQRCTVVLSILLSLEGQTLIIDQPEDNLDNAFITDTLVQAILARKQEGQLIFATHNANVPVLGDAELVVQLESDGRRGFVRQAGQLTDSGTIQAILSVMEGGAAAFRRRAAFYDLFYKQ